MSDMNIDRHLRCKVADLAEECKTLRTQLDHWKTFAVHAEGEHAAWKKTAQELDAELRALRDPAPLVAWITEGGCEYLQRGEGPVRVMPEENQETGFTVPLYARERPVARCPTGKCADPARDCYGSGCLSDEPQSAMAAAYGGLVQTPQG
jgi:hypothetical protein